MSTIVSKILTYNLIQSYLLKKYSKPIATRPLMSSWEIYEFFRSNIRRKIAGLQLY